MFGKLSRVCTSLVHVFISKLQSSLWECMYVRSLLAAPRQYMMLTCARGSCRELGETLCATLSVWILFRSIAEKENSPCRDLHLASHLSPSLPQIPNSFFTCQHASFSLLAVSSSTRNPAVLEGEAIRGREDVGKSAVEHLEDPSTGSASPGTIVS